MQSLLHGESVRMTKSIGRLESPPRDRNKNYDARAGHANPVVNNGLETTRTHLIGASRRSHHQGNINEPCFRFKFIRY